MRDDEIPRVPRETDTAYRAKVRYVTMGRHRTHLSVAETASPPIPIGTVKDWSKKFGWVVLAKQWDAATAERIAAAARKAYLDELAAFRRENTVIARGLLDVNARLIRRLQQEVDSIKLTPQTLLIAARTAQITADLLAASLQIDALKDKLRGFGVDPDSDPDFLKELTP